LSLLLALLVTATVESLGLKLRSCCVRKTTPYVERSIEEGQAIQVDEIVQLLPGLLDSCVDYLTGLISVIGTIGGAKAADHEGHTLGVKPCIKSGFRAARGSCSQRPAKQSGAEHERIGTIPDRHLSSRFD
jgi:hypothetical protein